MYGATSRAMLYRAGDAAGMPAAGPCSDWLGHRCGFSGGDCR
jgi:hypothetical protein